MNKRKVQLIDPSKNVLAIAQVSDEGTHFGGSVELQRMPADMRAVFNEFEDIVNGQLFSFLDEIEEKIESFRIKIVLDNGQETTIKNLQVFPATGRISFKLAQAQVASMKSA